MSYTLKTNLANKSNYGSKRDTSSIKYIVIHYTGNDGDTDESNATYFKNNIVKASAHYFVDDDSVTQSVPDDYVAWSVGGSKYSDCDTTGGGKYYGKCTNSNSISIELCDDVKNGTIYPSSGVIANAIELTKALMKKYDISASYVIRHFDVNGKHCPAYWCCSTANDNKWKTEFHNKLTTTATSTSSTTTSSTSSSVSAVSVDGIWGLKTTKLAQKVFGTTVDGKVSNQYASYKSKNPGLLSTTFEWETKPSKNGSQLIKAIQKKVGVTQDGFIGTKTIKAMQKWLGTTQDGYVSKPSAMVKAFQKWLNSQI